MDAFSVFVDDVSLVAKGVGEVVAQLGSQTWSGGRFLTGKETPGFLGKLVNHPYRNWITFGPLLLDEDFSKSAAGVIFRRGGGRELRRRGIKFGLRLFGAP
jgi:hypothetical protein